MGSSFVLLLALTAQEPFPGARSASGLVYRDRNGNGKRDAGEEGIADVRVTAGCRIAATGADGRYVLASNEPFHCVSVSFPSGTWPTSGWFRRMNRESETGVDFGLREEKTTYPFLFVQATDPHDLLANNLALVRQECEALPLKPKWYVCTGDIRSGDPTVQNLPDLHQSFGAIGANYEKFGAPLFMVPGNHDTVGYGGAARERITPENARHPLFANGCWERYVAPSRWSFSYGDVQFIGVEFAQYVDGQWNPCPPALRKWIQAVRAGARTVFFAHDPEMGWLVGEEEMTLGLFGHTHNEGLHFRPGSEKAMFPQNVLAGGLCQHNPAKPWFRCQDGRPPGYRLVVVEEKRIDTFYKAFDEPNTIMVNLPRRHVTQQAAETLRVQGQVFDPAGKVSKVKIRLGSRETQASIARRRLWGDFEADLDVRSLSDGFYLLSVSTGSHTLTEPYLLVTGRTELFRAVGDARIVGKGKAAAGKVLVNGEEIGTLSESMTIPAEVLRRLNRIELHGAGKLDDVRLEYDGREFFDQHRAFAWDLGPQLRKGHGLCFDLTMPGPAVQWGITPK